MKIKKKNNLIGILIGLISLVLFRNNGNLMSILFIGDLIAYFIVKQKDKKTGILLLGIIKGIVFGIFLILFIGFMIGFLSAF